MIRVGDLVRVSGCTGIHSDKVGIVIPHERHNRVRGIQQLEGEYKPVDEKTESLIMLSDGTVILMYNDRLVKT